MYNTEFRVEEQRNIQKCNALYYITFTSSFLCSFEKYKRKISDKYSDQDFNMLGLDLKKSKTWKFFFLLGIPIGCPILVSSFSAEDEVTL